MTVHTDDTSTRYPAPSVTSRGRPFTVAAFVCAGLALLFAMLAGIPGVILGIVGWVKGDRPLAGWAIAASIGGTVVGAIIGAAIVSSNDDSGSILLGLL